MHVGALLEVTLNVSACAYLFLLIVSFMIRDGAVWLVWRINIAFTFLATIGGVALVHSLPPSEFESYGWISWSAIVIALGRLGGAITNILLALHLRRLLRAEGGPERDRRRGGG